MAGSSERAALQLTSEEEAQLAARRAVLAARGKAQYWPGRSGSVRARCRRRRRRQLATWLVTIDRLLRHETRVMGTIRATPRTEYPSRLAVDTTNQRVL